jgi:ADP-heptose:LPS heptosyltransferase
MDENSKSSFRWRLLPLLFRLLFPRPAPRSMQPVKTVACLRPGKLGDMIVATPLFAALKKEGGVEHLAVLCSPANEAVIRHNPHVDIVRPLNFHRFIDVLRAIGWLRRRHFDAIIDLTPGFSRTNFLMCYYAGRRTLRVGIEKGILSDRYHCHVGDLETHLAERMLEGGEMLTGAHFERKRRYEIYTAPPDKETAAHFVRQCRGRGPLIAINLSAGRKERRWAYERFDALISLFSDRNAGITIALIAVGPQRQWAERLAAAHHACIAVPPFPFLTITELIGACSLLVSADTALIHVAAAREVPIVGLYTAHAENFARWRPYGDENDAVQSPSFETINDIAPQTVYEMARRVLERIGKNNK